MIVILIAIGVSNAKSQEETLYVVQPAPFNTVDDETSACFVDNSVIFFSDARTSFFFNIINIVTNRHPFNLKTQSKDEKILKLQDIINSRYNEEQVSATKDGNLVFFTSNTVRKEGLRTKETEYLQIYYSRFLDTTWSNTYEFPLNNEPYSVCHPSFNEEDNYLYFASDQMWGFGGFDIYRVKFNPDTDTWGEPENLGQGVNSSANEIFPHITDENVLYFSSRGNDNNGDLDIYKSEIRNRKFTERKILDKPINSWYDDFGYFSKTISSGEKRGFFTSNRLGGAGGDDVYWWRYLRKPVIIKGNIYDEEKTGLSGIELKLIDDIGIKANLKTDNSGYYEVEADHNTTYNIEVTGGELYHDTTICCIITNNFSNENPLIKNINLRKIIAEKKVKAEDIEQLIVYYDFSKSKLRQEDIDNLNTIAKMLNDNPKSILVIRGHCDPIGSSIVNLRLSLKRAESVVEYLSERIENPNQLISKGYGEDEPRVVSKQLAEQYNFLNEGDILTYPYILKLRSKKEREIAYQLNRRTDFRFLIAQ